MRDAYGFWLKAYATKALVVVLVVMAATGVGLTFAAAPANSTAPAAIYTPSHRAHPDLWRQALDENGGWQMDCTPISPTTGTCWNVLTDGAGY